jgi:secreted trypsin-like serine protease
VIAPTVVLTAAHCVPPGADLRIHYPEAGAAPVLLAVRQVVRHPDYRAEAIRLRERSVDLAVLRLATPLPSRFSPARLSTTHADALGAPVTVAGYGVTEEGAPGTSGRLAEATLAIRSPRSSVLLWAEDPSGRGAGACTGDSGGPVLDQEGSVVAVTLWASGSGSRHCGSLTQALWLAPHRTWIDRTTAAWSGSP